eukprot:CAMPEP_0194480316 /NCGR_PEP_ID=MMETSP0253-20130528/3155_1 /TAXON_ID=2966 /ORGANISM="Noctiluca scintillans" /LENGTH=237 /DNA_ID=CAMNT_0039319681 /DNA_START=83 /DNA_END=797 /DNA_ORIENTATION=-
MMRGKVHKGLVTTWVEERGYGFISPNDPKLGDLFVHVDALRDRNIKKLNRGDRVRFDVELNTNPTKNSGKKFAVNVELDRPERGRDRVERDRSDDRDKDRRCGGERDRERDRDNRGSGGKSDGAGVKVVAVAVGLVAFIARNAKVPVRVRRRDRAPAAARANAAPANAAPADRADGLQGRIKASAARVKVAAVAAAGGDGRDHVVLCSWKIDGGVFRPWETVLREVPSSTALAEAET